MRAIARVLLLLAGLPSIACAVPKPAAVAVLYNSAVPESRKLAELYRHARNIPAENLIALEMPATADISRADYEKSILKPLRAEFDQRGWWKRDRDAAGILLPVRNKIRVLVTVRGVPLRIQPTPAPAPSPAPAKPGTPTPPRRTPSPVMTRRRWTRSWPCSARRACH